MYVPHFTRRQSAPREGPREQSPFTQTSIEATRRLVRESVDETPMKPMRATPRTELPSACRTEARKITADSICCMVSRRELQRDATDG
jgi:hypothetical protein